MKSSNTATNLFLIDRHLTVYNLQFLTEPNTGKKTHI